MSIFQKKFGFTLAEILVTLGIIGVVAAMAIPQLNTAYQKHKIETRLKYTYSTILQGIKMAQASTGDSNLNTFSYENADVNGYSYEVSKDTFETVFLPVFKGAVLYPQNKQFNIYSADGSTNIGSDQRFMVYFTLANGNVLGFTRAGNYDGYLFNIILNPEKKKLIVGKDIFAMTFWADSVTGDIAYKSLASTHYSESTRLQFIENCRSNVKHPAYSAWIPDFCTTLIIKNGFKIPNDYPIGL